jgi:hypothetical protein
LEVGILRVVEVLKNGIEMAAGRELRKVADLITG